MCLSQNLNFSVSSVLSSCRSSQIFTVGTNLKFSSFVVPLRVFSEPARRGGHPHLNRFYSVWDEGRMRISFLTKTIPYRDRWCTLAEFRTAIGEGVDLFFFTVAVVVVVANRSLASVSCLELARSMTPIIATELCWRNGANYLVGNLSGLVPKHTHTRGCFSLQVRCVSMSLLSFFRPACHSRDEDHLLAASITKRFHGDYRTHDWTTRIRQMRAKRRFLCKITGVISRR